MPHVAARQEAHIRYLATLDEQQQIALDEDQQAALYEDQQAALYEQQQAALYGDQQAALYGEQQAALGEDQQAALYEQQQAALYEEQQAALYEQQQAALGKDQQAALYEEHQAAFDEEQQPQQEQEPRIDFMQQEAEPERNTSGSQQQPYSDGYEGPFGDASEEVPPPDDWEYSPVTPSPAGQSPTGDTAGVGPSQEEPVSAELDDEEQEDTDDDEVRLCSISSTTSTSRMKSLQHLLCGFMPNTQTYSCKLVRSAAWCGHADCGF